MSDDDGITRRSFLRGQVRANEPPPVTGPLTKDGKELPGVISWLDPEMRATPHRGQSGEAFPLLRPPGAVEEIAFLELCSRCGDCAEACPHDVLREAPARLRDAAGTPVIDPLHAACAMCEDFPCITACETGALRGEAPATLGSAWVQPLDCLNSLSATCSVCVERCPVPGAMTFRGGLPVVEDSLCTGCGVCQHACPAPQNAIAMLPNPARPTPAELDVQAARLGDDLELPDLHEGELDEAGLRSLFRDLEQLADVEEIRLKHAAARRADAADPDLSAALDLLLSGQVRGVQIRYAYRGEAWCDTVLSAPHGHRVVRVGEISRPSGIR